MSCASRHDGLVVKTSSSKAADPGLITALVVNLFSGLVTSDVKIGIPVATLPAHGVIGSALRLVGLVSAYCGWVR